MGTLTDLYLYLYFVYCTQIYTSHARMRENARPQNLICLFLRDIILN